MPRACASCIHFHPVKTLSARALEGAIGECRAHPPTRDLAWSRVRSVDFCSEHKETQAQHTLSLDATPEIGSAPLAKGGKAKGSGRGNPQPAHADGVE